MPSDTLLFVATVWLGSLLAYSGGLKLVSPPVQNLRTVEAYRLLPAPVARLVALLPPTLELLVGAVVLITPFVRTGAVAATLLGMVFAIASSSVLLRGLKTSCGCAGQLSEPVGPVTVLRASLIVLAGIATSISGSALPMPVGVAASSSLSPPQRGSRCGYVGVHAAQSTGSTRVQPTW